MVRKDVQIKPDIWLHTKSVAEFVQKASDYKSAIWIQKDDKRANGKSMLGILALEIAESASVTIIADGEDEEIAVKKLGEYISSNA